MTPSATRSAIGAALLATWLVAAPILALWAGGALYFLLHRASPVSVSPLTWLEYASAYWPNEPERRLLLLSILLPAALSLFPLGMILEWMSGPDRLLHGHARFATPGDIHRVGLMGSKGIIVGKSGNKFLHFPGQQFCLLAAPTRSGKGVSFVIPNLLNWPDSAVVLDIKLENFLLTSGYRARHGQKVYLFNPFAEDGFSHRWNPLDGISRDPNLCAGDILALATALYPALPGEKDAFWAESARNLFLGLALMIMETPDLPFTIGEVLRQSSAPGGGLKEHLAQRIEARDLADQPFSSTCVNALNRFMTASDNTLANIISSFTAPLVLFANPLVDAATSASDFDIARVRDERMTVYVGIQPNRLAEASLLINVFFSQLINLNTRTLPSAESHTVPCLLILDEFPALGKINVLAKANAFIAGYNLRLLTIIQSIAQLDGVYGHHDARTLMTNHAMQVLFTPREQRDANAYSEMLGYDTVKSRSTGRSNNRGFSAGGSTSENLSDQKRALMLPQELKELPDDEQIIILENTRPIQCRKARYFQERVFVDRLKSMSPVLSSIKGQIPRDVLESAAFGRHELAAPVPILKVADHLARLNESQADAPALETGDDISPAIDPADLPEISNQANPLQAEIDGLVNTFMALKHVRVENVAFDLVPEPTATTDGGHPC